MTALAPLPHLGCGQYKASCFPLLSIAWQLAHRLLLGRTDEDLFKNLYANTGRNVHLVSKKAIVAENEET